MLYGYVLCMRAEWPSRTSVIFWTPRPLYSCCKHPENMPEIDDWMDNLAYNKPAGARTCPSLRAAPG